MTIITLQKVDLLRQSSEAWNMLYASSKHYVPCTCNALLIITLANSSFLFGVNINTDPDKTTQIECKRSRTSMRTFSKVTLAVLYLSTIDLFQIFALSYQKY